MSSWVTGAKRDDFPASLKIQGDMTARVEIIEEPATQSFGKKTTKKGEEIDDVRARVKVIYLGGSARSKRSDEPELPARIGDEYTLWLGATLKRAILDGLKYEDGPAPSLVKTKWNIRRGEPGYGGQKVYEAELLEGDYVPPSPGEAAKVDKEELQMQLKDVIDKLGSIDKPTWYSFCKDRGAEDPEALTEAMAEVGYLKIESTKISKTG